MNLRRASVKRTCVIAVWFRGILSTACFLFWAGIVSAEPVDTERLRTASDDPINWVTFGHDYSNQHYSALAQVDRDTVSGLSPKWLYQTGIVGTFQTHPLVVDGQMFITTPHNHVTALDARTGVVIWHYQHEKRIELTRGGPSNRGAGLGYGKIFQATNDGRLIALDRHSGALVWDSLIATPGPGEVAEAAAISAEVQQAFIDGVGSFPAKMPPLVADGKVIVGVISAGYGLYHDIAALIGLGGPLEGNRKFGRRGYLAAFDAETGTEIWRWHTTKDKGWEGLFRETTPDGVPLNRRIDAEKLAAPSYSDSWRTGGGSTWMTPAYDPDLGLIYLGTGNASPADADFVRPGDNLYTSALVALDIATGTLRWHFQIVPHDIWGYDTASPTILFKWPSDEKFTLAVGVPSKNGWFYALDRETGNFLFKSEPFVPQSNLFARASPEGVLVAPGSFGGASWSPSSYDPTTGIVYVPAIHKPSNMIEKTFEDAQGKSASFTLTESSNEPNWGTLTAIDTWGGGRIVWQVRTDQPLVGGVLATAGGLVFTGEGDGYFSAFDSETGDRLWQFNCGAGVNAPPMAYEIDGVQYVAVAAGGHGVFGYAPGNAVIAFALSAP